MLQRKEERKTMLRKCYIHNKDKTEKAWFHQFYVHQDVIPPSTIMHGDNGGQVTTLFAVIEDEEHKVSLVSPFQIQFVDGGEWEAPKQSEMEENSWWCRSPFTYNQGPFVNPPKVEEAGNETTL